MREPSGAERGGSHPIIMAAQDRDLLGGRRVPNDAVTMREPSAPKAAEYTALSWPPRTQRQLTRSERWDLAAPTPPAAMMGGRRGNAAGAP
jgi:hypothetical protein